MSLPHGSTIPPDLLLVAIAMHAIYESFFIYLNVIIWLSLKTKNHATGSFVYHIPSNKMIKKKVKISSMNIAISQNIFSVQMLGNLIRKTLKLYTYINYSGNKNPNTMCDIPKDSEKWVESKYAESERLGIVPGTWFDKRVDVIINFFYDILYTVGFIWMRRTWWYNFHYVKHRPFQPSCCLTSHRGGCPPPPKYCISWFIFTQ